MTSIEDGKQLKLDNNFIMSPNDIATLDFMDQFLESGVRVLKIEGRGRSPEYVAAVIRAYRKAIDAVVAGTFTQELVAELYPELEGVFNRGLSSGYYLGREQGWAADAGNKSKRRKVFVGSVSHAYTKAGVVVIDSAAMPLSQGEDYLIIGDTTGVIEGQVSEMRAMATDGEMIDATEGLKGQTITLKINGKARTHDKLYKIVED